MPSLAYILVTYADIAVRKLARQVHALMDRQREKRTHTGPLLGCPTYHYLLAHDAAHSAPCAAW